MVLVVGGFLKRLPVVWKVKVVPAARADVKPDTFKRSLEVEMPSIVVTGATSKEQEMRSPLVAEQGML